MALGRFFTRAVSEKHDVVHGTNDVPGKRTSASANIQVDDRLIDIKPERRPDILS